MKNLLLVGDLRTGGNYGAIATSDTLINMLNEHLEESYNLSLIESRSIHNNTPVNGWKDKDELIANYDCTTKDTQYKLIIRKMFIWKYLVALKSKISDFRQNNSEFSIPSRYIDYAAAVEKVQNGSIFQYEKGMIEKADIVVINAEGTIVNGTNSKGYYRKSGRYMLFMAYMAKKVYDKKVYIINHTVDPANRDIENIIKNIYPMMDGISVREKVSKEKLYSWGIKEVSFIPDAFFGYKPIVNWEPSENLKKQIDFSKPYICLGDSTGLVNSFSKVTWDVVDTYSKIIRALENICDQIVFIDGFNGYNADINKIIKEHKLGRIGLYNCNYKDLYHVLEKSLIYISGRWHCSIMALCGHTPVLLWDADSHKTEALYDIINYKYRFFDINTIPLNTADIADEADKIIRADLKEYWDIVEQLKKDAKSICDFILL